MKRYLLAGVLALTLTQVNAQDTATLTQSAKGIAQQLLQQLASELRKELEAGGPARAASVCKIVAPEIAGRLSRAHGLKIARVSLKVRNPMLGLPDPWEQDVLLRFEQRLSAGEKAEALEHAEIVTEPTGRFFRYMRAIPVQPLCLACHGGEGMVSADVAATLATEYPYDQARGYSVGQLRGAVTVKQPLGSP